MAFTAIGERIQQVSKETLALLSEEYDKQENYPRIREAYEKVQQIYRELVEHPLSQIDDPAEVRKNEFAISRVRILLSIVEQLRDSLLTYGSLVEEF